MMGKHMIIDAHHHYQDVSDYPDLLADEYAALGISKVCLISPEVEDGIKQLKAAITKYPDLILGLPKFDWKKHTSEDIARFKGHGFAGVKFTAPPLPYNHKDFWPIYERCQELQLPGLFHLGILQRLQSAGFMKAATRADLLGGYFLDCNYMRPIYLDTLARLFPEWQIHGAHLGNPWFEEAAMSCRWNPNLYFDLTGSTLKKKKPEFLAEMLWWNRYTRYRDPDGLDAWEKIVFGSDVAYFETHDVLHDYDQLIRALNLSEDIRWKILGGTAAKIYKLE
ncbi:MAG: amidohydrolase family protein [Fidelibacterota bacterium]|nr:MAG: amidohydrolase family protein [Candidatus Neomarinimicrobiota bacterium]